MEKSARYDLETVLHRRLQVVPVLQFYQAIVLSSYSFAISFRPAYARDFARAPRQRTSRSRILDTLCSSASVSRQVKSSTSRRTWYIHEKSMELVVNVFSVFVPSSRLSAYIRLGTSINLDSQRTLRTGSFCLALCSFSILGFGVIFFYKIVWIYRVYIVFGAKWVLQSFFAIGTGGFLLDSLREYCISSDLHFVR